MCCVLVSTDERIYGHLFDIYGVTMDWVSCYCQLPADFLYTFSLEPCTGWHSGRAGPGSIVLKNHWAGPGRVVTGLGQARPWSRLARSRVTLLRSTSFPFAAEPAFSPPLYVWTVYSTIPRPHPRFPCGWINYIQHADCKIELWFVSAVGLETGSGRAGPVFFCSVMGRPGRNFFGPGRARLDIFGLCRALLHTLTL